MSQSIAIGQVSSALQEMLSDGIDRLRLSGAAGMSIPVTLLSLFDDSDAPRVNLFLYKIVENVTLKNSDWQADYSNPKQIIPPPLSLNLFYMLTPYGLNDSVKGNISSHELLGMAMKVLSENPFIPQSFLGDLVQARETPKIILCPFDMEECSKVWSASTKPYRLSVIYEVSTVQIDTGNEREITKRVRSIGTPQTETAFIPPSLSYISPDQGQQGCTVTAYGKNLLSWSKTVTISNLEPLPVTEIDESTFTFKIPSHYPCGLYQIRIQIDKLSMQTFLFEVTE